MSEQLESAQPVELEPAAPLDFKGVLWADDDPLFLGIIEHGFPGAAFAQGPDAALALLRAAVVSGEPYKVLVADVFMHANIDGVELCMICKELSPKTRRVLLTGYPEALDCETAVNKCHAHHVLRKPFVDVDKVREDILKLCAQRSGDSHTKLAAVVPPERVESAMRVSARAGEALVSSAQSYLGGTRGELGPTVPSRRR